MAAAIQSFVHLKNINTISSLVVNKPSGVVSGDLLILLVNNGTARTASSSGFTSIGTAVGTINRVTAFYKVAGGSEPSTYTVNLSGSSSGATASVLRIDGVVDPASNAIESATNTGTNNPGISPSVTPSDASSLVVRFIGTMRGNGNVTATPATTLFNDSATDGAVYSGCSYETCNATPSGTANFTLNREWAAITVAIAPTASGPSRLLFSNAAYMNGL